MSLSTLTRADAARFRKLMALAHRHPLLDADEERELIRRWRGGDAAAGERLVNAHLRLVAKAAQRFPNTGVPLEDLFSQGVVGLLQALRRFDPDRGVRFNTYALWWIRAAIAEHVMHSWSIVKYGTTPAQKQLFQRLGRIRSELRAVDDGLTAAQIERVSEDLEIPEAEVREAVARLEARDVSLNAPLQADDTDTEWQDWLPDDAPGPEALLAEAEENAQRRGQVAAALEGLDPRQRAVIEARWLSERPATLRELAAAYGVSCERIRQIEAQGLRNLRRAVLAGQAALAARELQERPTAA